MTLRTPRVDAMLSIGSKASSCSEHYGADQNQFRSAAMLTPLYHERVVREV